MFKKSFLIVLLIAMVFNTIGLHAIGDNLENKVELNKSGVIDSIEINPEEMRHGELTKITVNFSEKPGTKLTSNSIITLDAPTDLGVFEQSIDDPIELVFGGKVIGHVYTINNGQKIIMEFNKNVDNAYNHKGSFHVTARANFTNPESTPNVIQEHDFVTSMGTDAPETPYKITYTYTTGSNPFFYKPGGNIWTSAPNYVNWWLHVNRNREPFPSDLEVADTIQSGQKFVLIDDSKPVSIDNIDSKYFKITVGKPEGDVAISIQEFIDKGYGTFEFTADDSFIIFFDQKGSQPSNEYTVLYQTKITPEGKYQPFFYNDAIGKYTENGEEVIKEQLDRQAQNISSGGYITPEKGSLRIVKLAKDGDVTDLLPHATFKLYHEDGREVLSGSNNGVFETLDNGQVNTPPLDPGKYYVTELSAPDFVTFDPSIKYPFEMKLDETVGVQLVISNEVKRIDIDVEKVWEDNFDIHPNITLELLADGEVVDSVLLENGKTTHTFTNLPQFTTKGTFINYTIVESNVDAYTSVVSKESETKFVVTNTIIKPDGNLEAIKLVSKDEVRQEEEFEYTIVVNNTVEGSKVLENIKVEDALPAGLTFVNEEVYLNGVLSDAIVNGQSFSLVLKNVAYNDNHRITFKVKADKGVFGEKINQAKITNPEDPDHPLEPKVPVTVIPPGELKAIKTVSKEIVRPQEVFTYTITVDNIIENSDPLLNVIVEDTLPEGIIFKDSRIYINGIPALNSEVTENSFKVILDEVHFKESVEISFEVKTEEATFGEITNVAKVTDPTDPENPIEPEVPVTVEPLGKLFAEKRVSHEIVRPEESFTYVITVANIVEGSKALENVSVKDTLPEGLVFTDKIIKVNGLEYPTISLTDTAFEVVLEELTFAEDVEISFEVKAKEGVFGERVNKAFVVNPEDPENPEEPEVPITVIPQGELKATKQVSKNIVKPEEAFEYKISVENTIEGSESLKKVVVYDKLPEGLEFVTNEIFINGVKSATIVLNNSITVTIGELAYGEPVEISFMVKAKEGVFGTLTNKAIVTNPEDPENPEEPEVPVIVTPDAQIDAVKTVSQNIVKPEESFSYTITVTNITEGSDPINKVNVVDELPEGLEFINANVVVNGGVAEVTIKDNKLSGTILSLEYNKPVSLTFTVKAGSGQYGTKINKATVTNPEDPENPKEPEVPVTVIPDGKLSAEKLVSKNTIKPLENFEYSIVVKNTVKGSNSFKNVVVKDTLPNGIEFVDNIIYVNGSEHLSVINDSTFELTLDELAYGEDLTISFAVNAKAGEFGERVNKAIVTNPEDPENPEEPEVPVTIVPQGAMSAEKKVSQAIVKPNEVFEYIIKVSNTVEGSEAMKDVIVADNLPEGIEFVDKVIMVNSIPVDASFDNQSFTLTLETLSYGNDVEVSFKVKALEGVFGEHVNKAIVTNPEDPENPEEPEVPVTVIPDGKLSAQKEVSKKTVKPEEVFTYTIIVKNIEEGSDPLKDILVEDILPKGLEFASSDVYVDGSLDTFATVLNNKLSVTLPKVAYGDDINIVISVKALAGEFGERLNVATVKNPEDPENPEEPEVPITIVPTAHLEAVKNVSKDVVKPEETLTYSITVRNTVEGSHPLKGVVLKDTLPQGIIFTDGHIYVDGNVVESVIYGDNFLITLPPLTYGQDVVVSFDVKAEAQTFGERINVATVINPEDPDHPLEPEVPVEIIPTGRIAADKKVSMDEVEPNKPFEYTIIVKNIVEGSKPLKNVKVVDKLPAGIKYVNKEIFVDGKKTPVIVLADSFEVVIPELAYGKEVKVTFLAEALEGVFGEKINIATVTDPEDPENPEEPEVPVDIVPDGALAAEKLVSTEEVKPNDTFTYSIKVSNTVEGSDPIENVSVKDTLPKGIEFTDSIIYVNGHAVDATILDKTFEIVIESLAFNDDVVVSFEVKALEGEFGQRINIATVVNPEDPENPLEPEVPVVIVPDSKLEAEKLVSKAIVKPDEVFEYSIIVKNTVEGSRSVKDVVVKDTLPEGVKFVDGIIKINDVVTDAVIDDDSFSLKIDEVSYGNDMIVSFKVKALNGEFGERTNIATVVDPEDPENPLEPEVPVTIIPDGKLKTEKLVSKSEVKPNEEFEYTILVTNSVEGSQAMHNISVKDVLPEGLVFTDGIIYIDDIVSDVVVNGNSFEVILPSVQYGTTTSITFKVKALVGEFGERLNVATVTNPEDPENPEEPEVPVTIIPDGKLLSEKLVSKSEVKLNEVFEYSIVVKNDEEGSRPLTGIIVKDTLPTGLEFEDNIIYVNNVATDVKVEGQSFELILDEVHYGQDITVSFKVKAIDSVEGILINVATVINPEDPEHPQEPEVPVTVIPEEPIIPHKPSTPSTGIESSMYNFMLLLVSSLLFIVLLLSRKRKTSY